MSENDDLVKIHIDLTGNPDSGGEAMWAKPLGEDLFEIRNVPFYAYDLNFFDVVRAVQERPDLKPSIQGVARRSGHRTIWIRFAERIPEGERVALATELNQWKAYFEGMDGRRFAIDVQPEGDYGRTIERVEKWRREGILDRYRTGPSSSDVKEASPSPDS